MWLIRQKQSNGEEDGEESYDEAEEDDDNESIDYEEAEGEELTEDTGRSYIDDVLKEDEKDIDVRNIMRGKRVRKQTTRYEDQVFSSDSYKRMLLVDVPDDEMKAALEDEDFSEDDSNESNDYSSHAEEDEDEDVD